MIDFKIKEKPEDFIVSEKAHFEINKNGRFYLYHLIKKDFNTLDIAKKYNLAYAGLKDKKAITFQFVSSDKFLGDFIRYKEENRFYFLRYIGKINKKIKIGMLEGNYFSIKKPFPLVKSIDYFINYYDSQRIKEFNIKKGKDLLTSKKEKLTKKENFFIDSYISYLWNKSLKLYLKENFDGKLLENGIKIFIPYKIEVGKLPKFWTVLGYKAKLENSKDYYSQVLKEEGFELEEFVEILKSKKIKGTYRKLYEKVENFTYNREYISFYLKKGAYATMLLKFLYSKNIVFKP